MVGIFTSIAPNDHQNWAAGTSIRTTVTGNVITLISCDF